MSLWCPDCGFDDWRYDKPLRQGSTCPECSEQKLVGRNTSFREQQPNPAAQLPRLADRRAQRRLILDGTVLS